MKVLVTGGAGYIGSTIASALLDAGSAPIIFDNLSTGRHAFADGRPFYLGDIADGSLVDQIFDDHPDIKATVHCAALIVAPESVAEPLGYYDNNVAKSIALFQHLVRNRCTRIVFSSSAAIYSTAAGDRLDEVSPIGPSNPYGMSKAMIERVLTDAGAAGKLSAISLRYFNPIGADPLLRTGQQRRNPSNVLGKIIRAWESGQPFRITGVDWPTRDGSGIRDYIHVWDLALAHVVAVTRLDEIIREHSPQRHIGINLGTGSGTTVRELVSAFSDVIGSPLPTVDTPRRPGDVAGAYTTSDLAARLLGWSARRTLQDGIRDALRWRSADHASVTTVIGA